MTATPKTLTDYEVQSFLYELRHNQKSPVKRRKSIRNYCMAVLMLDAGLRVGEVTNLLITDLWFQNQPVSSIVVPAEIAKNGRERTVPVSARLRNAIISHAGNYWSGPNFAATVLLLPSLPAGGIAEWSGANEPNWFAFSYHTQIVPLTTRQVELIFKAAGKKSLGRKVNPHMLRHTFASRLMRITNARIVQQLLGHKNLSSTQIYTHPNGQDLENAINGME